MWIMETYPDATEAKRLSSKAKKTPLDSPEAMLQQIVAEIGAQRLSLEKRPGIKTTESRPRKYYFTDKSPEEEVSEPTLGREEEQPSLSEHDLYPLLREYLLTELGVFSKRIDERRSSNSRGSQGNRWLFPDIVGMEDLSVRWDREVIDCAKEYSDKKTKLWSFEVKLKLNSSNIRESYFQTVSNSSWSNFGYLVASEITGEHTMSELRILSGLHGIGILQISPENLSESQILIPARERDSVDWGTVNRLVKENPDFLDYVRLVRQFYQTGDSRPEMWR